MLSCLLRKLRNFSLSLYVMFFPRDFWVHFWRYNMSAWPSACFLPGACCCLSSSSHRLSEPDCQNCWRSDRTNLQEISQLFSFALNCPSFLVLFEPSQSLFSALFGELDNNKNSPPPKKKRKRKKERKNRETLGAMLNSWGAKDYSPLNMMGSE